MTPQLIDGGHVHQPLIDRLCALPSFIETSNAETTPPQHEPCGTADWLSPHLKAKHDNSKKSAEKSHIPCAEGKDIGTLPSGDTF